MSLSVPSSNPVPLTSSAAGTRPTSVTIDGGVNTGNVFDGRGSDFLDPDNLGGTITDFSGSIRPVTSNTLSGRLIGGDPLGKNPDSSDIMARTQSLLNRINSPNFGITLGSAPPVIINQAGQAIPDLGVNPDPTKINLFSGFFSSQISPVNSTNSITNFNPLLWNDPTATNILLGTNNSISTVLNGGNIFSNPTGSTGGTVTPIPVIIGGQTVYVIPVPTPVTVGSAGNSANPYAAYALQAQAAQASPFNAVSANYSAIANGINSTANSQQLGALIGGGGFTSMLSAFGNVSGIAGLAEATGGNGLGTSAAGTSAAYGQQAAYSQQAYAQQLYAQQAYAQQQQAAYAQQAYAQQQATQQMSYAQAQQAAYAQQAYLQQMNAAHQAASVHQAGFMPAGHPPIGTTSSANSAGAQPQDLQLMLHMMQGMLQLMAQFQGQSSGNG